MRIKHTLRLSPGLSSRLVEEAARRRTSQAVLVETALASYFSPDGSDRLEAALAKRLDRLTRQVERLERQAVLNGEAVALFVRFWLTTTSPTPDAATPAAQAKGRERYTTYLDGLGRRLAKGPTLGREVVGDVEGSERADGV